jgi:hypothetical protein
LQFAVEARKTDDAACCFWSGCHVSSGAGETVLAGAARAASARVVAETNLRQLTEPELARTRRAPEVVAPKNLVPSGETRDIHRAGGPYVTLVGSNPWFHLPQDRWPHAVDGDAVTRIAAPAAALVVKLTR